MKLFLVSLVAASFIVATGSVRATQEVWAICPDRQTAEELKWHWETSAGENGYALSHRCHFEVKPIDPPAETRAAQDSESGISVLHVEGGWVVIPPATVFLSK